MYNNENMRKSFAQFRRRKIIRAVIAIIVVGAAIFFLNRASIGRLFKDIASEYNNGLQREIGVYSPDGNLLKEYSGKIDVETNPSYIVFEDEDGKRHIIYPGASTVLIDEK